MKPRPTDSRPRFVAEEFVRGKGTLWPASNVKIYDGGVSEVGYLDGLSRLIGQYSCINVSRSHSRHGSWRPPAATLGRVRPGCSLGWNP
jgi:hypothetical protein